MIRRLERKILKQTLSHRKYPKISSQDNIQNLKKNYPIKWSTTSVEFSLEEFENPFVHRLQP